MLRCLEYVLPSLIDDHWRFGARGTPLATQCCKSLRGIAGAWLMESIYYGGNRLTRYSRSIIGSAIL
jgi:hypothetical protein